MSFITACRLLLHVVQFLVVSVGCQQRGMRAALHDVSLMDDTYLIRVLDGRQAVGDGNGCARLHEVVARVLHQSFALGVECRRG